MNYKKNFEQINLRKLLFTRFIFFVAYVITHFTFIATLKYIRHR